MLFPRVIRIEGYKKKYFCQTQSKLIYCKFQLIITKCQVFGLFRKKEMNTPVVKKNSLISTSFFVLYFEHVEAKK